MEPSQSALLQGLKWPVSLFKTHLRKCFSHINININICFTLSVFMAEDVSDRAVLGCIEREKCLMAAVSKLKEYICKTRCLQENLALAKDAVFSWIYKSFSCGNSHRLCTSVSAHLVLTFWRRILREGTSKRPVRVRSGRTGRFWNNLNNAAPFLNCNVHL